MKAVSSGSSARQGGHHVGPEVHDNDLPLERLKRNSRPVERGEHQPRAGEQATLLPSNAVDDEATSIPAAPTATTPTNNSRGRTAARRRPRRRNSTRAAYVAAATHPMMIPKTPGAAMRSGSGSLIRSAGCNIAGVSFHARTKTTTAFVRRSVTIARRRRCRRERDP